MMPTLTFAKTVAPTVVGAMEKPEVKKRNTYCRTPAYCRIIRCMRLKYYAIGYWMYSSWILSVKRNFTCCRGING